LLLGSRAELDLPELCYAVDDRGDFRAELLFEVLERDVGFFDNVVD
jgi:hypothetical protein